MLKVNALECQLCGDVIFSRARHDFRCCSCGEIFIDGGFDYIRAGFKTHPGRSVQLEIKESKFQLYDDWSYSLDKFGLIKNNKENNKEKIDLTTIQKPSIVELNMKSVKFVEAVVLAVAELRQAKPNGPDPKFSAYDITKYLRDKVNANQLSFSDRTQETIDGKLIFKVDHQEVRRTFNHLLDTQVITDLRKEFNSVGQYFVYYNNPVSLPAQVAPAISVATISDIDRPDVESKLRLYILKIPFGEIRTLKAVQSRFKGYVMSVDEIAAKLSSLGYVLGNTSAPKSKWTIISKII